MSATIQILPPELAEKIAAGEVIERPFSVVKELVENSIDAQARSIQIELEDGGLKSLRITDDGSGIPLEDMPLALKRHATSKIRTLDDLWNLSTMGFRGEALPSIAAVSHFTLESRVTGSTGRSLQWEGATSVFDRPLAANAKVPLPSGTRVSVEHLFYNVPARLKFMKSRASEAAAIRDLIERLALCHPTISFSLTSEGRKTLSLPATELGEQRFAEVLDAPVEHIEDFEGHYNGITVRGWWDREGRAANSKQVYLAVNGRMLKDRQLLQSCTAALRSAMMEGEYPRVFLEVVAPPTEIDVNVHPAKAEVRFQRARDVFQLIHATLSRIAQNPQKAAYIAPEITSQSRSIELESPRLFENLPTQFRKKEMPIGLTAATAVTAPALTKQTILQPPSFAHSNHSAPLAAKGPTIQNQVQVPSRASRFSSLQYVGQVKNTYLLFQESDGLILIDQHAAHERVQYELLRQKLKSRDLKSQPLLISITVKCRPEEMALALEESEFFFHFGFEFEAFGEDHLIVRSAPEGLESSRILDTFRALLQSLRENDESPTTSTRDPSLLSPQWERALSTAACHSSVRAGQPLSPREAIALVEQMEETPSSLNCPHGRPASIKLTFQQIENLFKRS